MFFELNKFLNLFTFKWDSLFAEIFFSRFNALYMFFVIMITPCEAGICTCVIWFVTTLVTYAFDGVTHQNWFTSFVPLYGFAQKKNKQPCLIARHLWGCFSEATIWRLYGSEMYLRMFFFSYTTNIFSANIHSNWVWRAIWFSVNFNDVSSEGCIEFEQAKCIRQVCINVQNGIHVCLKKNTFNFLKKATKYWMMTVGCKHLLNFLHFDSHKYPNIKFNYQNKSMVGMWIQFYS